FHPSEAGPHGELVGGEHRFAEGLFQWLDDVVGGQVGAADENCFGGRIVGSDNTFGDGAVVDLPDAAAETEVVGAHHRTSGFTEEFDQLAGEDLVVWGDHR